MQPPPRPGDLVSLDPSTCVELLEAAPWVRVAFVLDGAPTVLPVNVVLHQDTFYFQTASGSKLGTAAAAGPVALQADGGDPATREGWSVLAQGTASIVTDPELEQALWALPFEPWAIPDQGHFWVRIEVEELSGRRILRP